MMIIYDFIITHASELTEAIGVLNRCRDKIIAVTQHGNMYTFFYERNGNDKDGD